MIACQEKDGFELLINYFIREKQININRFRPSFIYRRLYSVFNILKISNYHDLILRFKKNKNLDNQFLELLFVEETDIFRDPEVWMKIISDVITEQLNAKNEIRILFPDFSSGEELLSLIILLKEYDLYQKVKISASSLYPVNYDFYSRYSINRKKYQISEENYKKMPGFADFSGYFIKYLKYYKLKYDILKQVNLNIFQKDVLDNNHVETFDIIMYRNKLLYYHHDYVDQIQENLYSSLNHNGIIITGIRDKMLNSSFNPEDSDLRIYRKV